MSTTCVSTAGAVSLAELTVAANIMYAKGGKQNIRNEFSQYSPEELEEMYKDPTTSKADRQKIKAAQKEKGSRHSSQSENKKRKK